MCFGSLKIKYKKHTTQTLSASLSQYGSGNEQTTVIEWHLQYCTLDSQSLAYQLLDHEKTIHVWQAILLFIMQNRYLIYQISYIGYKISNILY